MSRRPDDSPLSAAHPGHRWQLGDVALGAAVAIAYFAAAQLGFRLAFVAEQVTTVWAPTGIALATLFLGGLRFWPAIWLGAFFANAVTAAPVWTAGLIATGNTLEGVAAVLILGRVRRFAFAFDRVGDVLSFLLVAAIGCTTLSATVGVVTLCAAGVQPWERFSTLWLEWWLGDVLGAVLVTPAILSTVRQVWSRRDVVRAAIFVAGSIIVSHLVFGQVLGLRAHPLEYAIFPLVIGAAATGGLAVTALVVLSASAVAVWHTVHSVGPFAAQGVHEGLILLQVFMGVLAASALLLGAAIAERRTSESRERNAATMLRLAQHAGGIATFEWDFRRQVAQCSAEFFELFGLPARDGVMTGQDWGRFVHPDDIETMTTHLARALDGSEPAVADYRIVRTDGSVRWLTYAGHIQRTPEGDRMLGTVVDITGRKRLEDDLRHHVAELDRILASIGEGFMAFDRDFRYLYVNETAERMVGRARVELLGRRPWDVFEPDVVDTWRARLEQAVLSGAPSSYEVYIPGWHRWFENRVYPSAAGVSVFFTDVTARVEADVALRESRDVLSLAMRGGSMGAWSRDLETNDVWWSRELEEIFRLPPGGFDRTEAGFFDFIHPDDRGLVRAVVDEAVSARQDYIVEFRFKPEGGEWRWMEGRGRAVYKEDGTPGTLYGIGIDITERKRAEIALQRAKAAAEEGQQQLAEANRELAHRVREQETLLDVLPIGIGIATDPECRHIRTNRAFAETLGLHPDSNASLTAAEDERPSNFRVFTPQGTEIPHDQLPMQTAAREGREIRDLELDVVHNDGRTVRLLEYAAPLVDEHGQPRGAIGAFVDVTAAHQARLELQRSEEALRQEVEVRTTLARVGASLAGELRSDRLIQAVTDASTQLTEAEFGAFFHNVTDESGESYALYSLSGASKEAFSSFPHLRATQIFGPTFRGESIIRLDDVTADPRYGQNPPFHGIPPGHLPVCSYLAVPVVGREGEVLGGLFFAHSKAGVFTHRHELLAAGVAGWAAIALDNARLYQEAAEANRLKDEFLATLSHELRTPLNAVLGWSHMLREGSMPPSMYQRALESVERNARAQAQLVEDLLDISRIMAGKLLIKADVVDLAAVVTNAVETVRAGVMAKRLNLHVLLPTDERVLVTGDADRLQQVVWNLVSNAIKFTPAGGRIDIELRQVDAKAEIVVCDTGLGIDPAFRAHLFQRFRQMDASKTRQHGGLGLGLSIVRHLVEAHGGTVAAESEGLNCGATFRVQLPVRRLDPADRTIAMAASLHGERNLAGVHALIVDDEADARDLTRYVLERRGATVVVTASAGEALHLLASQPFDIIVADIGMPDQDGLSLIRALRSLPSASLNRDTPAVALTAYTSVRERDEAIAAGFTTHLGKPVDPEQLIAAISTIVGRVDPQG